MSKPPRLPGPPTRLKNIQWPSRENSGTASRTAVLIAAPRFAGGPQDSSTLARCDTHMSEPPNPPPRNDPKYRLRPSLEIAGPFSLRTELITGPRLIGVDHPENFGDPATGLDIANKANATPIRTYAFRLLPPCHAVSRSPDLSAAPPRSFL